MSNYLGGDKGSIIIHSSSTPTNIKTLTEATASSITSSDSIKFSPFQGGGLNYVVDSLATEDSGRSVDGYNHITFILTRVRKLEIQLIPCSFAYYSAIMNKVLGRKYYVTFIDPVTNSEKTCYVYTSNGKGSLYSGVVRNGLIQGASFNAIEIMGETS